MADDTDADDSASLTITAIKVGGAGLGGSTSVSAGSSYNSSGTSVTGTYGTLTIGADGTYTYIADQSAADDLDLNDQVTDTFTYTVSDGTATDTATLIFTVTGVNDAPVADNETGAVNEDATLTVSDGTSDLLHGDTDADDSASLTITTYSHTSATDESSGTASSGNGNSGTAGSSAVVGYYGTLTLAADGTYTYAADQNVTDALDASDTVTDVFTYTLSDGNGGTDTASITVTVTGVNDAPTSTGGTITTNEDENYTLTVNDFNFSDPDDSGSLNKVKITTLETNGNLEYYNGTAWVAVTLNQEITASDITSGYLRFRPDANENGSSYTTFGYQVSDGTVYSSATTMTVNVTAVNDAPVATDDASSVTEDSNVRVRANEDDLLNDDSDPESDSLTVTLIKPLNGSNTSISSGSSTTITGTYGQLTLNSNGSYHQNSGLIAHKCL